MIESAKKSNHARKLIYLIKTSGCRENHLIISQFADKFLSQMDLNQLNQLNVFLQQENDIDIYNWLNGKNPLPSEFENSFIQELINFTKDNFHNAS